MTALTAVGIYRGICVENTDPLRQGRIRVQVPRVLGPLASGWAFPAWGMGELGIYAEDRMPAPGKGVWVIIEQDVLYWFAVYGAQERPVPEIYDTFISGPDGGPWRLPVMPLATAVDITGELYSPMGVPNPDPEVELQGKVGSTWSTLSTVDVGQNGAFSFSWTRTNEDLFRVRFPEIKPFPETYSAELAPPSPANSASIAWTTPTAAWNIPETVTGSIATAPAPSAAANLLVGLMVREAGQSWAQEASGSTDTLGRFSFPWTRTRTNAIDIKAVFMGSQLAGYAETPVASKPIVDVVTTATLLLPTMTIGTAGLVTGTLNTSLYGPPPGTIRFQTRTPSLGAAEGGQWVEAAAATPQTNGTWQLSYTPTLPSADYRAYYPGSGVFRVVSSSPYQSKELALTTVTTMNAPATLTFGTAATFSGTVKDQKGANVAAGTVAVQFRRTSGDTAWYTFATSATVSGGSWTASGTPTLLGPLEWQAVYSGAYGLVTSTSATSAKTTGLGSTALTKGGVATTSADFSWTAVSGATGYDITRSPASATTSTGTSHSATGLANMTDYTFTVRAKATDYAGTAVTGAYSASIKCNTGRVESRKSGTVGYEARATATGTYRPSDGWGYNGSDLAQGYYSASTNNGFATMTYNGQAFRNWITANWGSDVVGNLTWNSTQVAMYRMTGSGTGSAITMWWYVTGSVAGSGGQPALAGGSSAGSLTPGASQWVTLPYAHWGGHVLLNENLNGNGGVYVVNSFCLYRANSTEYGKFGGSPYASNACNISVNVSWNFQTVAPQTPAWY